jgi:hypothetical protein
MAYPSDSDFQLPDGSLITGSEYEYNFQRIPIFWSSGTYDINVDSITANTYNNLPTNSFTGTTGESVNAGDVLRFSGGLLYKATNATDVGTSNIIGIANETVVSGSTVTVRTDFYNGFNSLTVGAYYYVNVDGGITTTNPEYNAFIIGLAVSSTQLNLMLKPVNQRNVTTNEINSNNFKIHTINYDTVLNTRYAVAQTSGSNDISGIIMARLNTINYTFTLTGLNLTPNVEQFTYDSATRYIYSNATNTAWAGPTTITFMISGDLTNIDLFETPVIF